MPGILNNLGGSSLALFFSCSLILNFELCFGIFNAVPYCIKVVCKLLKAKDVMASHHTHTSLYVRTINVCAVLQKED